MLSDRYGRRYTGSEVDSKSCILAGRQTSSYKTSRERERGRQAHWQTGQLAGWCVGVMCWREADKSAVAIKERDIWDMWLIRLPRATYNKCGRISRKPGDRWQIGWQMSWQGSRNVMCSQTHTQRHACTRTHTHTRSHGGYGDRRGRSRHPKHDGHVVS